MTKEKLQAIPGGKAKPRSDSVTGDPSGTGNYVEQKIGDTQVPYTYEVWGDGVYKADSPPEDTTGPSLNATPSSARKVALRRVSRAPFYIRRYGRAIDTNEELCELAFVRPTDGQTGFVWVDRGTIARRESLIGLAQVGVPVLEGNWLQVQNYLDAMYHKNGQLLPCVLVATRNGAYEVEYKEPIEFDADGNGTRWVTKKGWGWLMGTRWIGPGNSYVAIDPRNDAGLNGASAFVTSGDPTAWFDKLNELGKHGPICRWLCYSTFAAPLLQHVNQRTFIIHHYSKSGGGKTALLQFAQSAWGDPLKMMQNCNRTSISYSEIFRHLDGFPVVFDELQSSGLKSMNEVIYSLCGETGRGRATKNGGLQKQTKPWRTLIRFTGEEPLVGKDGAVDLGGQANRVVQINSEIMPNGADGRELHTWREQGQHFGYAGALFLERLRDVLLAHGAKPLCDLHAEFQDAISSAVPANAHARIGQIAVVALAQYLCLRWFNDAHPDAARECAINDATAVANVVAEQEIAESIVDRALRIFQDHASSNRRSWYDLNLPHHNAQLSDGNWGGMIGALTPSEIWLIQTEANKMLESAKLSPKLVWTEMRKAGVLISNHSPTNQSHSQVRRFGHFQRRVYVLDRTKAGVFTSAD